MKTAYVVAAFLSCAFAIPFLLPGPQFSSGPVEAHSTVLKYDQATADRNMRLDQGDAGLSLCFERALRGMLRMGLRDRDQILHFATTTCGLGFKRQLMQEGSSAEAADAYIGLAAGDHLDAILQHDQAAHP